MAILNEIPSLSRGALISITPLVPTPNIIFFQYNPGQLTRSLNVQTSKSDDGDRSEILRLKGPPIETINLEVELDATDQVIDSKQFGIYPQLSALELLVYPKLEQVLVNKILLAVGAIEITPPVAPLTLFVWGDKRVLPIKIDSFSITEEFYDVNLNPIHARVSLSLRVLNYEDLSVESPGYYLSLAQQITKAAMARMNTANL